MVCPSFAAIFRNLSAGPGFSIIDILGHQFLLWKSVLCIVGFLAALLPLPTDSSAIFLTLECDKAKISLGIANGLS